MATADKAKKAAREKAEKGMKARHATNRMLIANHREEYDALLVQNRVALGLTPTTTTVDKSKLTAKRDRYQELLKKINQELEMFGDNAETA